MDPEGIGVNPGGGNGGGPGPPGGGKISSRSAAEEEATLPWSNQEDWKKSPA